MSMQPFEKLSYRGKTRRLRQLAMNALLCYPMEVASVHLIEAFTNANYRVKTRDGGSYFIRVCEPNWRTDLDLISEVAFLQALSRDGNFNTPLPIASKTGDYIIEAAAEGVPESRRCMVMSWLPGVRMGLRLTEENLHNMGILFARLHEWSLQFVPPPSFTRHRVDNPYHRGRPEILFDDHFLPAFRPGARDVFKETMANVNAAYESLYADLNGLHVIHNDLHHDNIKVCRGILYPLDFEDTCWGFPVQDIETAFRDLMDDTAQDTYPALRAAFRQGYESIGSWPEQYPHQIDTFAAGILIEGVNRTAYDAPHELTAEIAKLAPMLGKFLKNGVLEKVASYSG